MTSVQGAPREDRLETEVEVPAEEPEVQEDPVSVLEIPTLGGMGVVALGSRYSLSTAMTSAGFSNAMKRMQSPLSRQ